MNKKETEQIRDNLFQSFYYLACNHHMDKRTNLEFNTDSYDINPEETTTVTLIN